MALGSELADQPYLMLGSGREHRNTTEAEGFANLFKGISVVMGGKGQVEFIKRLYSV